MESPCPSKKGSEGFFVALHFHSPLKPYLQHKSQKQLQEDFVMKHFFLALMKLTPCSNPQPYGNDA
jgi:hypothetical protein